MRNTAWVNKIGGRKTFRSDLCRGWRTNRRRLATRRKETSRMSKALRVLITGAARGIGMATAQVLANRGHWVVATDISVPRAVEGIQAHVLDVTSDDESAHAN